MKPGNTYHIVLKAAVIIVALIFSCGISFSRDNQQQQKKTAAIDLSFYKNSDGNRIVVARVSSKNDSGKLVFAQGVSISFYSMGITGKSLLKNISTGEDGKASIHLPPGIPVRVQYFFH